MAKHEDTRSLKDQATKEMEKRRYDRAAELYVQIAQLEPEPDWPQRAGEAYRRAGNNARAVEAWTIAADGYARGGFLLKAIAVNKSILQLDPAHTKTQALLAELYARRDGVPAQKPAPATAAPVVMQPPLRDEVAPPVDLFAATAPTMVAPARPMPAPLRPPPRPVAVVNDLLVARADAPMEVVPLRSVLGARRSETIAVSDILELAEDAELAAEDAAAYEIDLDDAVIEIVTEPSKLTPLAPDAPTAAATPPPGRDELDFGGLLDAEPERLSALVPEPPSELPRIPLFSSLPVDELRLLIDRMTMRSVGAGEVIVREGERGGSLFVLVDGRVRVTVGADARELAVLEAGAFFGEMGVLSDDPRSATVTASEPTQLLEISRELTWDIARRSPEVLRTIVRFFRDRLLDRLIGASTMFSQLSPDDARALAQQFVFLELEVGVAAVKQGARAPGLFFLLCGQAEAVRDGRVLGALGPGDVFGEISLLTRSPASADVRATKKCWALELPQARFQEIMLGYPQILEYVSNLADARRKQLDDAVRDQKIELV